MQVFLPPVFTNHSSILAKSYESNIIIIIIIIITLIPILKLWQLTMGVQATVRRQHVQSIEIMFNLIIIHYNYLFVLLLSGLIECARIIYYYYIQFPF